MSTNEANGLWYSPTTFIDLATHFFVEGIIGDIDAHASCSLCS